jgi:three-Cys-motif partner protein
MMKPPARGWDAVRISGGGRVNPDACIVDERLPASEWTPTKQQRFERLMKTWTAIAAAIQRKWSTGPWLYVDLTAGSGRLRDGERLIDGSPLIALRAFMAQPQFAVECVFIERHRGRFLELLAAIDSLSPDAYQRQRISCGLFNKDHVDVLSDDLQGSHRLSGQFGLAYWDGFGQDECPMPALNAWMAMQGRIDLVLMASGCAPKRAGLGRDRLDRVLHRTIHPHRWVARPETAWQWTFALMSNWPPLGNKLSNAALRFAPFTSKEGSAILDSIGTTVVERQCRDNPGFFDGV